jgi:hypothetical protein
MTRHKDKAILYWFGPPDSKTLRPVLDCITSILAGLHGRGVDGLRVVWRPVLACHREDALARLVLGDRQGQWTGVQIGYNRET